MSTAFPNEPTGFTELTNFGHSAIVASGWTDVYDVTGYNATIVADASAPLSPSSVLRQRFPAGLVGGNGGGGGTFYSFGGSAYEEIFFAFWFRVDVNFINHPVSTKICWIHTTLNGSPQNNNLFLAMYGNNPYYLSAVYQQANIDNSHINGGPIGTIRLDPFAGSFSAGQWVKIEIYWRRSSANTSTNGIWKVWINNSPSINVTNLNTDRMTADSVSYITIWGGVGSALSRDCYLYWDHSYVSAPSGGGGGTPPTLTEPTNLYPRNISLPYGLTTFSWGAVPGASNYDIRIHKMGDAYEPSSVYLAYARQAATSITVTTEPNSQYDWWVSGVDGSGTVGPTSGGVLTTTAIVDPPPPNPDPPPDPPPPPPVDPPVEPPPPVVIPPVVVPPDVVTTPQVLGTATVVITIKDRQNPIKKEFHFYG